ncbi:TraR/DksA C4-type zinc finger protein [Shouchella patagoniensis]|uniref:TraR/DksA C4-type zinc finger protein n=1 Tax=Shouchella patagoniensis TaxID=228576 RepID=UPI000994AB75|nr:TraR/DksA C4-type zinc finger protein [Shouchella patagoniensis]
MDKHLREAKQTLECRKVELLEHIHKTEVDHNTQELSEYDNHPADNATDLFDREKDAAIHQHMEEEVHEIEHALKKIMDGSYGICEKTGKAIPLERLEAFPTARTIVSESKPFEEYRPVEEDVLRGFSKSNKDQADNETEFDGEDAYQMVARFNDTSVEYDEETGDTDLYGANGVEEYEGFLSTGIDGYHGPESVDIQQNEHYKAYRESRK